MAEYVVRGLVPGATYGVQAQAYNDTLTSPWSTMYTFLINKDQTPPSTVQNLTWVAEGDQFVARWTANSETDFSHYVYTLSNGTYTYEFQTTSTEYTLTFDYNKWVFNGTPAGTVTFSIWAVDTSDNASAPETRVATNGAPALPATLTADGGYESVNLKWDRVPENDLAYYEIQVATNATSTKPGSPTWTTVWKGLGESYIHYVATLNTYYWFRIRAVDKFGTPSAGWREQTSVTGILPATAYNADTTAPNNATNFSATAIGTSIRATWTASNSADIAGYYFRWKPTTDSVYTSVTVPGDAVRYDIPNLTPGVSYDVQMRAFDNSYNKNATWITATGSPVAISGAATGGTPAAPDYTKIKSFDTYQTLSVYWDENAESDVKWGAGQYDVEIDTTAVGVNVAPTFTSTNPNYQKQTVSATAAVFNNVVRGLKYWIRVRARSSSGVVGAWSTADNVATNVIGTIEDDIPIGSLPADRISANSAFVHKLFIRDDPANNRYGSVESDNYAGGTQGFKLSSTGLDVRTGTIAAGALQIQSAPNVVLPQYAGFNFNSTYYRTTAPATLAVANVTASIDTTIKRYGLPTLKVIQNGVVGTSYVFLGSSTTDYNTPVDASKTYIGSVWVYNPSASPVNAQLRGRQNGGGATYPLDVTITVPATSWARIEGSFTTASDTSALVFAFYAPDTSTTLYFTALQLEAKVAGLNSASYWNPPGATSIDGGILRTGSIRSNISGVYGGITQPPWVIDMDGDATFGNAFVRGKLTVGTSDNLTGPTIQSYNYGTGTGWAIKANGDVEFNSGKFSGDITGSTGSFAGSISSATGTFKGALQVGSKFWVDSTGNLGIGGTSATTGSFTVSNAGVLNATGAVISGAITATSGYIGSSASGWTINSSSLVGGTSTSLIGGMIKTSSTGSRVELGLVNSLVGTYGLAAYDSSNRFRGALYWNGTSLYLDGMISSVATTLYVQSDNVAVQAGVGDLLLKGEGITIQTGGLGATVDGTAISLSGHTHSYLSTGGGTLTGNLSLGTNTLTVGTINASGSVNLGSDDAVTLGGTGQRIKYYLGATISFVNSTTGYINIRLNQVQQQVAPDTFSHSSFKREIKDATRQNSPGLAEIRALKLKKYKHRPDLVPDFMADVEHTGVIVEETPDAFVRNVGPNKGLAISEGELQWAAIASIQELADRLERLENKGK